jgi:hypothetical protein
LLADDILAKIVETKQLRGRLKIHKVILVGKSKMSYCIETDGTYSHGDTIKEARESLLYKIGKRDKSRYKGWSLNHTITKIVQEYVVVKS